MSYRIGMFSRLSKLTPKTLRHYHKLGLLVPSSIDESTGYRIYSDQDLERAQVIRTLKSLELPLNAIEELVSKHDDDSDLLSFLEKHRQSISEQIRKYQDIERTLDATIHNAQHWKATLDRDIDIQERKLPPVLFAGQRKQGQYSEIQQSFKAVGRAAGFRIAGPAIGLFYDESYQEHDANFEGGFPVKRQINAKGIECRELPGGPALSVVHIGGYDTIGATYTNLFREAARLGMTPDLPTREVYLKGPGMIFRGNPEKYRTEIQLLFNAPTPNKEEA